MQPTFKVCPSCQQRTSIHLATCFRCGYQFGIPTSKMCQRCGNPSPLTQAFCGQCGTPFVVPSYYPAQPARASPGMPKWKALVIVMCCFLFAVVGINSLLPHQKIPVRMYNTSGIPGIFVFRNLDAAEHAYSAINDGDYVRLQTMMRIGDAFVVSDGTQANLIGRFEYNGLDWPKVEITSGFQSGLIGYAPSARCEPDTEETHMDYSPNMGR